MKAQPLAEALFTGSTRIDHMRKVVETVFGLIFNALNPTQFDFSNLNEAIRTTQKYWRVQGNSLAGQVLFELGGVTSNKIRIIKFINENPDLKKLGANQIFDLYNSLDGLIERLIEKVPGFKEHYDFFLMVSNSPIIDDTEGTLVLS